ncbi:XdhC family protein [Bordetella avium]|uniref:Xanthine dehydrogenase accessory factor n=1 Tax=Bordetella avium (strain 197N) TaxID=360910 RepID=Q2KTJ4_BORA1|nr:XdhC family protein [Bordetella avium]RIQ20093.1 XdhC family protein [Bordetella avium]RIQ34673.1 XdhC family protein [Bordetella avium]RIQ55846.1 XdhC family protein [Bordetella avium]RIQ69893.1 XdhC family protein [Bordetella avium]RIQ74180.1 XdhC family protein [Bordetella avium]
MNALDQDVLRQARDWLASGYKVHLITVAQTWGSAPRQPGALLALRDDGRMIGSVSGGCIEDDLCQRARSGKLTDRPALLEYGVTRDDAARFGLPCGGTLRLVCEPLHDCLWLDQVLDEISQHRLVQRSLNLGDGTAFMRPALPEDVPSLDGEVFRSIYGPRWRLLIIGANQTAQVLCSIARALEFHVLVCDPRPEVLADWDATQATLLTSMPDDAVLDINTDERCAIVAITHDPKLDDMALLEALKSRAFYVGALGSRANQAKRRERLRLFDLSDADIDRLRGPVGLPIGSRTPAEIAVAIAAELVAVRNSAPAPEPTDSSACLVASVP